MTAVAHICGFAKKMGMLMPAYPANASISKRRSDAMNDDMKKYWEQKLLEMAQEPTELFKTRYPVTWRQRLHNRFLNAVDWIYEKLTGHCPYEE